MTLVFGITGGIATGKSTVSNIIKSFGFTVIDADVVARQVMEPGEEAYNQVVEQFGEEILLENKAIDRKKLGGIVFHNEAKRLLLNSIVHPAVRKKVEADLNDAVKRNEPAVFLDIPLLYESNYNYLALVDKVIVVYTDVVTQLSRLMERNQLSKDEAQARINSQIPIEEKRSRSDEVIDNRGTVEETHQQVIDLLKRYKLV